MYTYQGVRTINKPATLLKVAIIHGYFSRFLNCTNGTKWYKASHMMSDTKFSILILNPRSEGPMKYPLFVCPCVCLSVCFSPEPLVEIL